MAYQIFRYKLTNGEKKSVDTKSKSVNEEKEHLKDYTCDIKLISQGDTQPAIGGMNYDQ